MSKNGNTSLLLEHFWISFDVLFCLLIKNLILECKTIWQYEKVSMSNLKCEYISSNGQRRNISILKTAHWYVLNFLDKSKLRNF